MSNRQKIQSFCKRNKIILNECHCKRSSDSVYNDNICFVEWFVTVNIDGNIKTYNSGGRGDTTPEEVLIMLEDIAEDIEEIRNDPTTADMRLANARPN